MGGGTQTQHNNENDDSVADPAGNETLAFVKEMSEEPLKTSLANIKNIN